jgi:hypothetical protein
VEPVALWRIAARRSSEEAYRTPDGLEARVRSSRQATMNWAPETWINGTDL